MCLSLCCFCVNKELPQIQSGKQAFVKVDDEVTIHVVIYEYQSPNSRQPGARLSKIIEENTNIPEEVPNHYRRIFLNVDKDEFLIKNIQNRVDNLTECLLMQRKESVPFYDPTNEPQIPSDRPTLFLIHGVGGSHEIWTHQINYFVNRGYRIVVPNLIGHGESSRVSDAKKYNTKLICNQMLQVFDLYATEKNVIIGHSYGTVMATYISKMRPDKIKKMVQIGGAIPYPVYHKDCLTDLPYFLSCIFKPLVDCHVCCFAFESTSSYLKHSKYAFNAPGRTIYNTMKRQRLSEATSDYHKEITQKCLVIEGGKDNLIDLENSVDFCMIVPDCYLVIIENLTHMGIIEHPLIINEMIEQFLAFDA